MKRILALAIDDERPFLDILRRLLVGEGIDVVPAETLSQGFREIAERDFDCILLDLNLDDTSGIATFWKLKAGIRKKTPIVVVSGNVSQDVEVELAHADVRVLRKPLDDSTEISELIKSVVTENAQTRSASPPGVLSMQMVQQIKHEVGNMMQPMAHDVGRLVAWMNASLASEKAAAEAPRSKRTLKQVAREQILTAGNVRMILMILLGMLGMHQMTPQQQAPVAQQEQHAEPSPRWQRRTRDAETQGQRGSTPIEAPAAVSAAP